MSPAEKHHRTKVIVAFALVYVLWGSTYLGIKLAVETIPPALMASFRFLIAGPVMLAACALTGRKVSLPFADLWRLTLIGVLLLTIGNVGLSWAELYVPSGLAALIVAIVPIWFLIVDVWIFRSGERLSRAGLGGIALGIVGMFVLLWPQLRALADHSLARIQLIASLALLFFSFSWAFGSVLSKKWQPRYDPFSATGWQMTLAGIVNLALAFALREPARATYSTKSVLALAYLIVFGSWIGYTAYIWLLNNVPTAKVSTYAYVNPVVAVFLGWLMGGEKVDIYMLAGSAIVVSAVALVTRAKIRKGEKLHAPELAAVEAEAD
jgi:drug/metabolite transporter (DMT)-like permease